MASLTVLAIFFLSISGICLGSPNSEGVESPRKNHTCCFSYTKLKIPKRHVVDYTYTSEMCSQPGVIFITRKGLQICADPSSRWVQTYVASLEAKVRGS
ncbi:C-C motif chemokine 4-like [Monodelphis domestica]|uniref:C-C motif chemokine n=1 Tax=Monodelphis domestica TaxID=13616 RepID=K7E218_MONDO|nr:C-C motif chemokine 4-like [Monodelphis domestica]